MNHFVASRRHGRQKSIDEVFVQEGNEIVFTDEARYAFAAMVKRLPKSLEGMAPPFVVSTMLHAGSHLFTEARSVKRREPRPSQNALR